MEGVGSFSDLSLKLGRFSDSGLKLASRIITTTKAKNNNFVFSPASINVALSLLAAGSTGETLDELLSLLNSKNIDELNECMSVILSKWLATAPDDSSVTDPVRALHQPQVPDFLPDGRPLRFEPYLPYFSPPPQLQKVKFSMGEPPKLAVANAVWIDQSCKIVEQFQQVAERIYNADVKQVDFKTKYDDVAEEVNSWAEEKTKGLIKNLLPPGTLESRTRLVLTNAIYFKASWVETFNVADTKDHPFRLLSGEHVKAPFMTNTKHRDVSEFDGFKVLSLCYKRCGGSRKFSMLIYLPDADDGLPALAEKLGSESDFVDKHIPFIKLKLGKCLIPKFKITYDFKVGEVLENMGIGSAFTNPNGLAELATGGIVVDEVIHKAFIEVNEEGTAAAASTAITGLLGCCQMPPKIVDFVADHPFLFIIREDISGLVLFVGQVLDPTKE